jgi:hypothetical protein
VYRCPFLVKSYLHPFFSTKYMLMQGLLVWENNGAPDLHTAQFPPVLVNPAHTLSQEKGDILRYHYHRGPFIVNVS